MFYDKGEHLQIQVEYLRTAGVLRCPGKEKKTTKVKLMQCIMT